VPWTFAHPAAVLPLRRLCPKYLSFVALVVGSITPDLGYYFGQFRAASFAHTISGSLVLCLPSGLVVLALLFLLRKPLLFLLPQPHRHALTAFSNAIDRLTVNRIAVITYSLVLGAWTHIVWDSFTHYAAWGTNHIAMLREPLFHVGTHALLGYQVLQRLSTLVGTVALVVAYAIWLRRHREALPPRHKHHELKRWGLIAAASGTAIVAAVPIALSLAVSESGYRALGVFVYYAVIYATAVFVPLIIALALVHYLGRDAALE
jgi:uncharacterized protein DUF4184